MDALKFKCHDCGELSSFKTKSDDRIKIERFGPDKDSMESVRFICEHCGTANDIDITKEKALEILSHISKSGDSLDDIVDKFKRSGGLDDFLSKF